MIYTVTLNPALDKEYRVPRLIKNSVLRVKSVQIDYGGKGFNVSRMLSFLGTESTAIGFIGGHTGQVLQSGLEELLIKTDLIEVSGETRTNVSIVSDEDMEHIKVNESGPHVSKNEINKILKKIQGLITPEDWWVLAGSLPLGASPDIYAQMIEIIHKGGARAILDTSGEALKVGCFAKPFLIKPNINEAYQVVGINKKTNSNVSEVVNKIHKMGVQNIVLSAGKKPSILSTGDKQTIGTPPVIEEKNPTGAGDAMLSAIVYRLESNDTIQNAFAWGIAAGTAAASQPGTGMPQRSIIEELLKDVVIEE